MKRALVLSLICVLGLAFSGLAATLSGSWDTDVTIDPQQTRFDLAIGLTSEIIVIYTVGDWAFTSTTGLTEAGWDSQSFDVAGVLGAFTLSSALVFDPDVPEFTSWNTTAGVTIAGVSFGVDFNLFNPGNINDPTWYNVPVLATDPAIVKLTTQPAADFLPGFPFDRANDLTLALTGSGVAGDVTVDVEVTFGAPNSYVFFVYDALAWDATNEIWWNMPVLKAVVTGSTWTYFLQVGSEWVLLADLDEPLSKVSFVAGTTVNAPLMIGVDWNDRVVEECDLDWTGITIDLGFPFCCAEIGFSVEFDCTGFVEACFSVTDIVVPNVPYMTLDADLCFTMDEKTLVLTPAFDFGAFVCFDLYFDVDYEGRLTIQDISIIGIGLDCTIGTVDFSGLSWWGTGTKPGLLKGTDYWEVYNIATSDDACCGPFSFDLSFFFLDGGAKLFDIAEIDASMELQIATQFSFNMGLNIEVDGAGFTEWTVGFMVTW